MKLVFFAHTPPPHHGQSFMVEQLLKQLRAPKFQSSESEELQILHVNARLSDELEQIGHWHVWKLFRAFRYVLQAIWLHFSEGATAMYYVPAPGLRIALYRDWLVIGICRLFFDDIIYHWHAAGLAEWIEKKAAPWERRVSERLLRGPALSIGLGEFNRADAEWALSRRIAIVANGIPDPCSDQQRELETRRKSRSELIRQAMAGKNQDFQHHEVVTFRTFFIGLCCEEKGLFDAMDGVVLLNRILASEGSPVRAKLSVAGTFFTEADRAGFEGRMARAEMAQAVEYRGFVSGETKQQLFAEHDCLVFPTYYAAENSPLVLIEAMAYGLKIVTTRWRGIPELLPGHFLVEPKNPQMVASALYETMRTPHDPTLRRRFLDMFTVEPHAANVRRAIIGAQTRRTRRARLEQPSLSLTYSLADQDFARTKSIGIYNVSVQLARALAAEPRLDEMTVLANPTLLHDLSLRRIQKVEIRNCIARTPLQRILWDQWNLYSAAKRVGNEWLLLPKGYASFIRRPSMRLAAYVHDMMNEVYATEYAGQVSFFENFYFQRAMMATLRNAELILTNTDFTAGEVRRVAKIYNVAEPRVVCVGIGFQRPSFLQPVRQNRVVVLTSRWPHKRTDLAVGWLQRWQRESGFSGSIRMIGSLPKSARCPREIGWEHDERVAESKYRELIEEARVLVYFSDHEGFGMPPVEAALAGACPVYSSLPPTREAMGNAGMPFFNTDYDSFRRAMNDALKISPETIAVWSNNLLERHQWSRVAERVVTALQEASSKASTAGPSL